MPRRKSSKAWNQAAPWCSTATIRNSLASAGAPRRWGIARIVSFGEDEKADARLLDISLHATCSAVHADILGDEVTYKLGMPGRHMAINSLAVLAASSLAGADLALASLSLTQLVPAAGRGGRHTLVLAAGEVTLIDESL